MPDTDLPGGLATLEGANRDFMRKVEAVNVASAKGSVAKAPVKKVQPAKSTARKG